MSHSMTTVFDCVRNQGKKKKHFQLCNYKSAFWLGV